MKHNLSNGIAAQGYDVVSFYKNGPTKGSKDFSYSYNGGTYLFNSAENKQTFDTYQKSMM